MIKYQKRLTQYVFIIALGPLGAILEKKYMFKEPCSSWIYWLTIVVYAFAFFLLYFYIKEKRSCKVLVTEIINKNRIVVIEKSKWNDLIIKIKTSNSLFGGLICRTVYNPELDEKKRIKWIKKLGIKFIITKDEAGGKKYESNCSSIQFEYDNKLFQFIYYK